MEIRDFVDYGVPVARRSDSVYSVVVKMISRDYGTIPVVEDDDKLVGVVTLRDVMLPMYPNYGDYIHDTVAGRDFVLMEEGYQDVMKMTAEKIMTPNPMTVAPDSPLLKAASYMGLKNLRRIPVVEDGKYVGIVGIADVNKALFFNLHK
ncbi:MAG: cyclic nucleotide-binding/CBS domain-containing protein [Thermodesulfobacteriota bacterium]